VNNEKQARNESANAYLYLLATMVFFGSAFASSKAVVGHMPHQVAAVLRFGGGALILVLLLLLIGRKPEGPKATRGQIVRAAAVGLLGVFASISSSSGASLSPPRSTGALLFRY
jgi:drug/metabolite transporter (DMT)-like permease